MHELPAANSGSAPALKAVASNREQVLYLSDTAVPPGQIDEFDLSGKLLRRIRDGIYYPGDPVFDGAGTLYALNGAAEPVLPDVTEYALGATQPSRTVKRGISYAPRGIGVDSRGDLWVLDSHGPLVRYRAGETTPEFATYQGLCAGPDSGPAAIAVDRFGTAYVGVTCGGSSGPSHAYVREYDGTRSVTRSIQIPSNEEPAALTTDDDGRLYLQFFDSADNFRLGVAEYKRGSTKPSLTFEVTPAFYNYSAWMSFDSSRVYFADGDCSTSGYGITCTGAVSVYQRGSSKHLRTISAPSRSYFEGTAVDDSGNVYVSTFAFGSGKVRILVYPPTRSKAEVFIRGYGLGDPVLYPGS